MENYYKTLGVDQTSTSQQINDAYKSLLILCNQNPSKYDHNLYIDLIAAHNTLSNKAKREEYDRILNSILSPSECEQLHKNKSRYRKDHHFEIGKKRYKYIRYGITSLTLVALLTSAYMLNNPQTKETVSNQKIVYNNSTFLPKESSKMPLKEGKIAQVSDKQSTSTIARIEDIHQHNEIDKKQTQKEDLVASRLTFQSIKSKRAKNTLENEEAKKFQVNTITEKDKVLASLGTPNSIIRYGNNMEIWHYAHNTIHFENDKVVLKGSSMRQNY